MIGELERVFETSEGGLGQGVIRFQPISRMNAVMVVTKNPKLLAQTTQWVRRLDRSDTTGTTLRTFKLKNGKATEVAKILNDIFGQKSGSGDSATKQLAPGVESAQARIDSLDRGSSSGSGTNANGVTNASNTSDNRGAGTIAAAFETFAGRKNAARRTLPAVRPAISRAERSRTCEFQRMRATIRLWSIPTRRTIGSSNARFATSTGR